MPVGVDDAIILGVGVALGWGISKLTEDDDAPIVSNLTVVQEIVRCKETVVKVRVTIEEDAYWYQDDSGLSQVTVTGEDGQSFTMYPNKSGAFKEEFEFWLTHKSCRSEAVITLVPEDKNSNKQGVRKIVNVTPPYCCDPAEANAHGCDCTGFNKSSPGYVSLFPILAYSDSE